MSRELIYQRLRRRWGATNNTELTNHLQNAGQVSDECETIDQVADSDLMRAYNRSREEQEAA